MGTRIMSLASASAGAGATTAIRGGRAAIITHHRHHLHRHLHLHLHRRPLSSRHGTQKRRGDVDWSCKAATEQTETPTPTTYQGIYGPWTIDPSDVTEVLLYRTGLVAAAASFLVATSPAFLPPTFFFKHFLDQALDFLFLLGASGLGLSLYFIHIYVAQIKRTLQALWVLGAFGSFAAYITLARPAGQGLVQYVIDNPSAVWFIGPIFASLTGLVIKEGLCYGKLEAAALAFIIPTCLLGHLTGTMDNGVKTCLLGLWVAFFAIFSGRKFTQPLKDDIGDKSVFMFNALSQEEKKALLERSEQQKF